MAQICSIIMTIQPFLLVRSVDSFGNIQISSQIIRKEQDGVLFLLIYYIIVNISRSLIYIQLQVMSFNIFSPLLRRTPHFDCLKVIDLSKKTPTICYQFQFKGPANPFLPLIKQFIMLTFPTKTPITQELINFMLAAVKVYRQHKLQNFLQQQFFGLENASSHLSFSKNSEIVKIMQQMLSNSQAINNKTFRANQKFPPIMSVLRDDFKQIAKSKQGLEMLKTKLGNNLSKYEIIPRAIKIAKVKALAQALESPFETKINVTQNSLTLTTKGTDYQVDQIVPLQMLLHSSHMIDEMDEKGIQDGCRRLLQDIISFQKCTQEFYQDKKAEVQRISRTKSYQKQVQKLPHKQKDQSFLALTPQNVVFYLEKINLDDFCGNQDLLTAIRTKSSTRYRVNPDFCSIDLATVFLKQLGIKFSLQDQRVSVGPMSFQDQLAYHFYPPLQHFNFSAQNLQNQSIMRNGRAKQIQPILAWLAVVSALDTKFIQKKASIYEQNISSDQFIDLVLNKGIDKTIDQETNKDIITEASKQSLLGSKTVTLLLLYELQLQQPLSIQQFEFSTWSTLLRQVGQSQIDYFYSHKYDKAKLLLQTMDNIYFGQENFKYMIEKTSYFSHHPNIARYLMLFLVSKYIQISFQREILSMYEQEVQDIRSDAFGLRKVFEKYEYGIFNRVESKIKTDYEKRSNNDDLNRKFLNEHSVFTDGLYTQLISTRFGSFIEKGILKIEELRNRLLKQIKGFLKIGYKQIENYPIPDLVTDQVMIITKNLLLLETMFVLEEKNYPKIEKILAQLYKMKESFAHEHNKSQKLATFFKTYCEKIRMPNQ